MPFSTYAISILSASEVMQKRNNEAFGDITGVHIIADDMTVAVDTVEEHDKILHQVMQRARQENVQFNKRKLHAVPSITGSLHG